MFSHVMLGCDDIAAALPQAVDAWHAGGIAYGREAIENPS